MIPGNPPNVRGMLLRAALLLPIVAAIVVALRTQAGAMAASSALGWPPLLLALHLGSDAITIAAYVAVAITLGILAHRLRGWLPSYVLLLIGILVARTALLHAAGIWDLWSSNPWLLAGVKAIGAIASVVVAIVLPTTLPRIRLMLEAANGYDATSAALLRSEAEFRGIFTNAHDAIVIFEPENERIVEANPAACKTYGVTREEFIGRSLREFSVDIERGSRLVTETLRTRTPLRFESLQKRADGTEMHVEVSGSVILYQERLCILAMTRDITERKLSERRLRESEARLHEAQRLAQIGDWTWDAATRLMTTSPELQRIFELPAVVTTEEWEEKIHPYDLPEVRDAISTAYREGSAFDLEYRVLVSGGRLRWIHARGMILRDDRAKKIGLRGTAQDITALESLRDEREELLDRLTLILNSTGEGIVGLDMDGAVVFSNRAASAMLGISEEKLRRRNLHALVHREGNHCGADCAMVPPPRQEVASRFGWFATESGDVRVDYSVSPMIERGDMCGSVVVFSDTTERYQLETQLEQNKRLGSIGRLAATMAHEFNNVLMGVWSMSEVIARSAETPRTHASAMAIADFARRGKRVTEVVLKFARPTEPRLSTIHVARWLAQLTPQFESVLRHDITLSIEQLYHGSFAGDAAQLGQVLSNLVINAADAMPTGGELSIVVDEVPGAMLRIDVTDTGTGIAPELVEQMFEPLVTTKRNGTGLGLSVAHQIIGAHGGKIEVQTAPGKGTTISCFLPIGETIAAPPPRRVARAVRGTRLLVVEDDPAVSSPMVELLVAEGLDVTLAQTGAEAEAFLAQVTPDAVILDIHLPDIDGVTLFERLRGNNPDLPVVFSSGHIDDMTMEPLLQRGRTLLLRKPYEMSELLAAVNTVLQAQPAT